MYFKISLLKHSCLVGVHEGVDGRYCFSSKRLFNYLFNDSFDSSFKDI